MAASSAFEDEIDLRAALGLLWARRWFIVLMALVFTTAGGLSAVVLPKRFSASTVLSPVSAGQGGQLGGLSSLASQFGGLASLAGISVSGDSQKSETLAVLQSETLTESFIAKNDLLPVLYAKQWDAATRQWGVPLPRVPTLWQANQYFGKKVRTVSTETKTGLVTLTITWTDPVRAAQWANGLVKMANDYLRDRAITEAERNIAYLNDQAARTDSVGIKQAIYPLLQAQLNKAMLARGSDEYALKVLDPAFVPQRPSSPSPLLLALAGFLGGTTAALFLVLLHDAHRTGGRARPAGR